MNSRQQRAMVGSIYLERRDANIGITGIAPAAPQPGGLVAVPDMYTALPFYRELLGFEK